MHQTGLGTGGRRWSNKPLQAHGMCLKFQPCFDSNHERVYTDFASREWLEHKQVPLPLPYHSVTLNFKFSPSYTVCVKTSITIAAIGFVDLQAEARRYLHPSAVMLGMMLYSDGAQAHNQKHHYHPIIIYLANFTLDTLTCQRGYVRLAHMSVLDIHDLPCCEKQPDRSEFDAAA